MTPEEVQRDIKLFAALKPYADRDRNCTVSELRALCEDVKAVALAYARPIVAEECAVVVEAVELDYTPVPGVLKILERDLLAQVRILVKRMKVFTAAAIREHGRSK